MSQKQQYDEAEQQRLYDDSIRSYWTPDRIRCAKVEDDSTWRTIPAQPGKNQQAYDLVDGPLQCTEIDDKTRKDPPYNYVGLIYFCKGEKQFMATAYVVKGKTNIVFTAAHNLCNNKGMAKKIMFIPACPTDLEQVNWKLDVFPQIEINAWVVSSNWDPFISNLWQYDIGAIKLSKNGNGKEVGDVLPGFEIELRTDKELGYEKGKTEWKIIGYNVESDTNDDYIRMYESNGTFLDLEEQTTGGYLVIRNNPIYKGMSGGPWLLKNESGKFEKSNGNVAAFGGDDVVTPFYTKELIDDILKQL